MSEKILLTINVAKSYTILFWIVYLVPSLFLIPFPFIYWYKRRVINRNYIELHRRTLRLYQGRWFVLDDDVVYTSAVDHIKIDRSIIGYFFGWCSVTITTRSGQFDYHYMDIKTAELLRGRVIT